MNTFRIAINTIKINITDKKTLAMMVLFPIILILILGNALKNVAGFSVKDLGKTTVYYFNEDSGKISQSFDELLKNKDIKKILDVKKAGSYDEGKRHVDNKDGAALIYINKDYSDNVNNDKKAKISIYESKSDTIRNSIVKSIVDSFNNGANTTIVASKLAQKQVNFVEGDNVEENYISVAGKSPGAIDYYSVTMLVLILMYGANYGCSQMEEFFFDKIGRRIRTTGVKLYEHLLGVLLGVVFTLFIQAMVLVLFTRYVYNANWGSHYFVIIGTMLALSALSTSIGILFMTLTGAADKASGLISIVVPIFTVVSGGYFKIPMPDIQILNYVPNKLAQVSLFNSIYENNISTAQSSIAIMFVMAAVFLIIASAAGRRKFA